MSQLKPSSSIDICCYFCGELGNLHVNYRQMNVVMCQPCVLAGNLVAEENLHGEGFFSQHLLFRVGDTEYPVQEDLEGAVEFSAAGLQAIEFFEDLKEMIFESTQFNSQELR